jgi:hypothetical protein
MDLSYVNVRQIIWRAKRNFIFILEVTGSAPGAEVDGAFVDCGLGSTEDASFD